MIPRAPSQYETVPASPSSPTPCTPRTRAKNIRTRDSYGFEVSGPSCQDTSPACQSLQLESASTASFMLCWGTSCIRDAAEASAFLCPKASETQCVTACPAISAHTTHAILAALCLAGLEIFWVARSGLEDCALMNMPRWTRRCQSCRQRCMTARRHPDQRSQRCMRVFWPVS